MMKLSFGSELCCG